MTMLERVEFLAPKELLESFDAAWPKRGFKNRTEAMCNLMRKFAEKTGKEA